MALEALTDKGPVIRSSRVEQRNAEQQARAAATASSPIPNNAQQQVDAAQIVTPVAKVNDPTATTKPEYLLDWNTVGTLRDAYNKLGGVLPHKIIKDRERWGIENNKPIDYTEIVDMIPQGHSINKTKEENEAEEKKLRGQERMEKFANFLKHLGNFVGTVGFGAPSQTLEHPKELTARQQAIRDKTEALRSAYNKSYFENYYKQRADDLKQQNQDRLERRYDLAVRQQEWKELSDQKKFDYNMEKLKIEQDYKDGLISLRQKELAVKQLNAYTSRMRANTANYNAHNPKDYVVEKEETTPFGKKKTTTKKTYRNSGSSNTSTQKSGNDWSQYKTN